MSAVYKQDDEFDQLGKRKAGRPKGSVSVTVGKANIKALARKAALASEESLDFIIEVMRNTENKEDLRYKAACYIVGATQSLVGQVDKQTLLQKQYALLDKKIEEADRKDIENDIKDSADAEDDSLTSGGAVFSLDIVR